MKKPKRYMLDIETLGNYGCAVLLQISAISFDGKEVFNVKFDPDKQPKSITTEQTIEFWSDKQMPIGDDDFLASLKTVKGVPNERGRGLVPQL